MQNAGTRRYSQAQVLTLKPLKLRGILSLGHIPLMPCDLVCRIYLDRQMVNARFMALLQPDALLMPSYLESLCEVRAMRALRFRVQDSRLGISSPVHSPFRIPVTQRALGL